MAVTFAGEKRVREEFVNTALGFGRTVVQPLLSAGLVMEAFVAGDPRERQDWVEWLALANMTTLHWVDMTPLGQGRPLNQSHVANCVWGTQDMYKNAVHEQFKHLDEVWQIVKDRDADYVMRARDDLFFHPRQRFQPCWLQELPQNTVLSTDKAHQDPGFRWNELKVEGAEWRTHAAFPAAMCDQFFWGHRQDMGYLLGVHSEPPLRQQPCNGGGLNPEAVTSEAFARHRVDVQTVSLQIASTKRVWVERDDKGWVLSPCRSCYACVNHF
jgi:hypothetical protein